MGLSQNLASSFNPNQLQVETNNGRSPSKTAPARLEGFEDENGQDQNSVLIKVNHYIILSQLELVSHNVCIIIFESYEYFRDIIITRVPFRFLIARTT